MKTMKYFKIQKLKYFKSSKFIATTRFSQTIQKLALVSNWSYSSDYNDNSSLSKVNKECQNKRAF